MAAEDPDSMLRESWKTAPLFLSFSLRVCEHFFKTRPQSQRGSPFKNTLRSGGPYKRKKEKAHPPAKPRNALFLDTGDNAQMS
jgi:hypothetical protein